MHINFQLENMCKENGFDYILNKNIVYEKPTYHNMGYFFKDGLHLNASGRQVLLDNFIKYLDMDWLADPYINTLATAPNIIIHDPTQPPTGINTPRVPMREGHDMIINKPIPGGGRYPKHPHYYLQVMNF